jgi:glycosyltransferase involved in cell wall biosynthesis
MRILFVQKDRYERSVGGSEFYEHHLGRELARRHDVRVFCTRPDADLAWHASDDGTPPFFEAPANAELFPGSLRERQVDAAFASVLAEVRPDLVHIQDLYRLSPAIPRLAESRGIPSVFTLHEFYLVCPRFILRTTGESLCEGPSAIGCARCAHHLARRRYAGTHPDDVRWRERLERRAKSFLKRRAAEIYFALGRKRRYLSAAGKIDLLLCPSRTQIELLKAAGVPAAKLRFLPYALPDLGPPRPKSTAPRLRFAFIGTPARHKGLFVLLDLLRQVPDLDLRIYGKVPSDIAPAVEAELARYPNARLGGVLSDADKPEAFATIDVLVVPSIWHETGPFTILEAFHFRTPVIATRLGGMAERLSEGGGWLVTPEDSVELSQLIRHLRSHPEETIEKSRTIPPVEPLDAHARKLEAIYEELCERRTGGEVRSAT